MHAFRIGRVFGIDLRVDWSWVFIFVLMTWNLFAVFSHWHPAWSPFEDGAIAVLATLLFFGCILLHELAHSVVAMGYGLKVRSITLFMFGGVSNIEHEPPSPRAEFFTAIAGPLTSIGLGLAFVALTSLAVGGGMVTGSDPWAAAAELGPVTTLLAWLGPINVLIGLFNLVPGFPLDGGRVLRSIVWRLTGDLRTATRLVSGIGQATGWGFILIGLAMTFGAHVPFFGTGFAGGLWLAFIGWFLNGAARQATVRIDIDEALAGHSVGELMRRHGPVVSPDVPLTTLVHEYFMRSDDRAWPVVRDGRLLGIVTLGEVGRVGPEAWATMSAKESMRGVDSLVTTTPDASVTEAFARLASENVEQLPVVQNGELVGMLRRNDVARFLELVWQRGARTRGVPARRAGNALRLRGAHG